MLEPVCRGIDERCIHPASLRGLCGFGPFPGREMEQLGLTHW